jgi:uncharacterized protein YceK
MVARTCALPLAVALSGCVSLVGTAGNMHADQVAAVSGLRGDISIVGEAHHPFEAIVVGCIVVVFDLPFSLVLDAALLPVTLPQLAVVEWRRHHPDAYSVDPPGRTDRPDTGAAEADRGVALERAARVNRERPFDAPRALTPRRAR